MRLRGKEINNFKEPLFVADIGQNHDGSIDRAKELVLKAKQAGCDYAKFQSWDKDSLFIESFYKNKPAEEHIDAKDLEEQLDIESLKNDDFAKLVKFCKEVDIGCITTPVSNAYVDMLVENDVDFIKIASFDLNNLEFLRYAASKGKPIFLSTGLSTLQEIEEAINTIFSAGNKELVLLHCIAVYPPKDKDLNLNNIDLPRNYFGLPVGFSDHSIGVSIPLGAIAKGACVIEKHFTYNSLIPSGDHPVSADPEQMETIVKEGKRINIALGRYKRVLSDDEKKLKSVLRRSIVSAVNINKGEPISKDMIEYKRPGTGIQIEELPYLLNRKAKKNIAANKLILWKDVE